MTAARQLTLDLPQRPALGRADFVVAPCNETAVAWIDRWPDWPHPVLAVHGPPASGKSHLARVWRQASGAAEVTPERLNAAEPPELLGADALLVFEDVDRFLAAAGQAEEERLLHLYNLVLQTGGQLLLTAAAAPARWRCNLPDLGSRLAAAHAVELGAPDDALIEALLIKLFSDRQLRVGPQVVRYLLARVERSFAALGAVVAAVDRAALSDHREITVPLVRRVVESLAEPEETEEGEEPEDGPGN